MESKTLSGRCDKSRCDKSRYDKSRYNTSRCDKSRYAYMGALVRLRVPRPVDKAIFSHKEELNRLTGLGGWIEKRIRRQGRQIKHTVVWHIESQRESSRADEKQAPSVHTVRTKGAVQTLTPVGESLAKGGGLHINSSSQRYHVSAGSALK